MDSMTLESVETAFCDWRAQRSSRTDPIPEYLWAMALKCRFSILDYSKLTL